MHQRSERLISRLVAFEALIIYIFVAFIRIHDVGDVRVERFKMSEQAELFQHGANEQRTGALRRAGDRFHFSPCTRRHSWYSRRSFRSIAWASPTTVAASGGPS